MLEHYSDMALPEVVDRLIELNVIFVPNRSFAVYVGYNRIENEFAVPIFGNRRLLRWEERVGDKNYYKLLDKAGIRRPKTYSRLEDAENPVIVKLPEAKRRVERAFFIAGNGVEAREKLEKLLREGVIDEESLRSMVVEEYVDGAHFNINYFASPLHNRIELHSIDRRLQSNIDDVNRLPSWIQEGLSGALQARMIEVGHIPATMRESLLNKVFMLGYQFAEAARELEPPGVIGPFTLQAIVTPRLDLVVYDVAPRIGGGTNAVMAWGGQYSHLYYGEPLSMGERIALEIKTALEKGGRAALAELVT